MPQKSQTISTPGIDAAGLLAYGYGALEQLQWTIKYSGNNIIIAYTPRKWSKWDDEIRVEAKDNELIVTSKLVHGESWDMMGKNKKHIQEFQAAFESVRKAASEQNLVAWKEKIHQLEASTAIAAQQEVDEAMEADKVMNFSTGGKQVTYGIIIINVIIFVLMVVNGIDFLNPESLQLHKWGGSLPASVFGGEWWRLISSMFLHAGILHIALNMYALYFVGSYLEPMLGKTRFIAAYMCSGIVASLVSVLWHKNELIVGVGASGAIFGMFGVFLALLTTNIIPKKMKNALLQSVLIFVAYNVFYGFKPGSGVDNAAHLGGLISGMLIGYIYYFSFKRPSGTINRTVTSLVALATVMLVFTVVRNEKTEAPVIDYETGHILDGNGKKFLDRAEEFDRLEKKAISVENRDDDMSTDELLKELKQTALPAWKEAKSVADEMESYTGNEKQKKFVGLLQQYTGERIEYTRFHIKDLEENTGDYEENMKKSAARIEELLNEIKELNTQ